MKLRLRWACELSYQRRQKTILLCDFTLLFVDCAGNQGQILLKGTALGEASKGKSGHITKVHHALPAVMVHWDSSDRDEEAGWSVLSFLTS
jgi:hypothetical protein